MDNGLGRKVGSSAQEPIMEAKAKPFSDAHGTESPSSVPEIPCHYPGRSKFRKTRLHRVSNVGQEQPCFADGLRMLNSLLYSIKFSVIRKIFHGLVSSDRDAKISTTLFVHANAAKGYSAVFFGICSCFRARPPGARQMTKLKEFFYFPGCRFVCFLATVIIVSTFVVIRILMLDVPPGAGIIRAIQEPYFRRFGVPSENKAKESADAVRVNRLGLSAGNHQNKSPQVDAVVRAEGEMNMGNVG
ncbi:unnamed protein product [Calicophoron daubneyi]|uniref:Uncharacterized protein n=1 Tax=Calicophoron daubneyi TaxID=300641 RepID=A0AAV2T4S4_CALDB